MIYMIQDELFWVVMPCSVTVGNPEDLDLNLHCHENLKSYGFM
jgi:hypothetical protein